MSNHDKIAKLKEYIKNYVIEELEKDEELDEVSTTASAGAANPMGTGIYYDTPKAFSSGSAVGHKSPEVGGYKKVNESYARMFIEIGKAINASKADDLNAIKDLGEEYDIGRVLYMARTNPKALRKAVDDRVKERKQFIKSKNLKELKEGRYHDWRNDESMTPKQKVGQSMREIRDALNELDKTVKMNLKLKTELKMNSQDYWKNTHKALTKISERLVKMANKVGNLK